MILHDIQSLEDKLINSPNSCSAVFTEMMYKTREWIETAYEKEFLNYKHIEKYVVPKYSAYKFYVINPNEMEFIINKVAKFIELGSNLSVACVLAGYSYNVLRPKFTNEHKEKFKKARKKKYNQ